MLRFGYTDGVKEGIRFSAKQTRRVSSQSQIQYGISFYITQRNLFSCFLDEHQCHLPSGLEGPVFQPLDGKKKAMASVLNVQVADRGLKDESAVRMVPGKGFARKGRENGCRSKKLYHSLISSGQAFRHWLQSLYC